ncbi:MAG: SUMF1/EgtB/PvdO family nonheme iron enzyme [Thiotrichales bacterium]
MRSRGVWVRGSHTLRTPTRGACATTSSAVAGSIRSSPGPDGAPRRRRVVRGGAWNNKPDNARSANRNRNEPDNRNNNFGFRLASTLVRRNRGGQGRLGRAPERPGPRSVDCSVGVTRNTTCSACGKTPGPSAISSSGARAAAKPCSGLDIG